MARQEIEFVLSDETDAEFQAALAQLATATAQGWKVVDLTRAEGEAGVKKGAIVIERKAGI